MLVAKLFFSQLFNMSRLDWSFILWTAIVLTSSSTAEYDAKLHNESKIFKEVVKNPAYFTNIAPEYDTNVKVSFTIVSIVDFDVIKSQLHVNGIFRIGWNDRRLKWNRTDYGDVGFIPVTLRNLWKPEISLFNTVGRFVLYDKNQEILAGWVTNIGDVTYASGGVFSVSCAPDVSYFPFDEHECYFTFVKLNDIYFLHENDPSSTIFVDNSFVDKSAIRVRDGEWKYRAGNPCVRKIENSKIFGVFFPIKLLRRWPFTFFNILIPVLLLSFLNVCVYLIPIEAGERVSFAITVLLSYTVFMIVTIDIVPSMSDPMPILSYFLAFKMLYSSCIAVSVIIVSKIYHHHEERPIPRRHRRLVQLVESIVNCKAVHVEIEDSSSKAIEGEERVSSNDIPSESKMSTEENKVPFLQRNRVTWGRVSMALDKVLMCVFLLVVTAETLTYLIFMYQSYTKDIEFTSSQICSNSN